MSLQELFLDPLQFQFMERALTAAVLVGLISGVVGTFVVVRGMSFLGDALAHSVLPGVAIAYIYGRELFIGGLVAGIGTALGIGLLTRDNRVKEDTAIGVVFAGMFALGVGIISTTRTYSVDLTHILFGNVLGIDPADLRILQITAVLVLLTIMIFYKELLVISFDTELGRVLRLPTEFFRLLLLVLVAMTIVASIQTVGVSLMLAMLITPAATARLLVKRLHYMLFIAAGLGAFSGAAGLYLSFHQDIASGPAIVLVATGIFLIVFLVSTLQKTLSHQNL